MEERQSTDVGPNRGSVIADSESDSVSAPQSLDVRLVLGAMLTNNEVGNV